MIMGNDIGVWNIGAYHHCLMAGRTPNIDQLAVEGMLFTDYYAEASCRAGRANFITGELPIRTGMTTVGQAGSPTGMPDQAPTIATDAEREWAYDRNSSVGKLDKALDVAQAEGWTVVDMKNDWKTIFPFRCK